MKKDVRILQKHYHDQMYNESISLIATECFIKGLVLDLSKEEKREAMRFANESYLRMDLPYKIQSIIKDTDTAPYAKAFLKSVDSAIEEVLVKATNKVTDNGLIFDENQAFQFDDSDLNDFTKKRKDLRLDDVANIIKDKVVQTIKNEKEAYEKSEQIKNDIKEIISEDKSDNALEAYYNLTIDPSLPKEHISLFTKIQDICIEALMTNVDDKNELPYNLMDVIAMEAMSDITGMTNPKSMDGYINFLESVDKYVQTTETDYSDRLACATKKAFVSTIMILTMFETLNTLNLLPVGVDNVNKFLSCNPCIDDFRNKKLDCIKSAIDDTVLQVKRICTGNNAYMNADKLNSIEDNLKCTYDKLTKLTEKFPEEQRLHEMCTIVKNALDTIIDTKAKFTTTIPIYDELGYYAKRSFDTNVANISRYIKMLEKNATVRIIEIRFNSAIKTNTNERVTIDIYGLNEEENPVASYSLDLIVNPLFGATLLDILKNSITRASVGMKPIRGYLVDKSANIPLVDELD